MPLPIRSTNDLQTKNWKTIAIVDGLEITGNAGTIIRSADGAGLDGLVFIKRKVRLTHPKVLHASQGACFSMPIFDGSREEVFKVLDKIKANIFLGDSKANSFFHQKTYPAPCAIVLGSEKKGINTDWYQLDHKIIKIPMLGSCNSLNVACAATLLFYQTIKPSI
ncbi:MAG: hypothetical protein MPK62_10945 [Alphaproteobacteria bacterium]|nr:hypothetical protein [Alphaproteobacteria bacterium]